MDFMVGKLQSLHDLSGPMRKKRRFGSVL